MLTTRGDETMLVGAFSIIEDMPELELVVSKLRDLLSVDHLVYHSSKFGASPSADPFIRLTYPAEWIKRYLQNGLQRYRSGVARGLSAHAPVQMERPNDSKCCRSVVFRRCGLARCWPQWLLDTGC